MVTSSASNAHSTYRKSHASLVVASVDAQGIDAFVRGWRQHFLDVMRPRFLPPHWSVNARVRNSSSLPEDSHFG